MKKIIAVHGNPGHPEDWTEVKKLLPKDHEFLALDAYDPDLRKKLISLKGPYFLTGFSMGCYSIMKCLPEIKDKVSGIVFVAPYFIPEKPLSVLAKGLLGIPFLSRKLIESSKRNSVAGFLDDMIAPQKLSDHPYYKTMLTRLETTDLWTKTVKRKIDTENNPLSGNFLYPIPVIALRGKEDKTNSREKQTSVLKAFSSLENKDLTQGGHALLWSHPDDVANALTKLTEMRTKIGYYPGIDVRNNVLNYLEGHLRDFPGRTALRWGKRGWNETWDKTMTSAIAHEEINYLQMAGRISAFANGLKKIGITKGDRIIIFLPMSLDMYVAMFAVQRIGAIAVFLDSWARAGHLGATAECVGPKGMVSFGQAFELVDQVPEFKTMPIRIMYGPGEGTHKFEDLLVPGECPMEPVESETTALITFTTGSTGKPKGANRTHRFLSAQHHALSHVIPYAATDIDMPIFPIFSLNNLATGVTTVLPAINLAAPTENDPAILTNQILNNKINCATMSPSNLVGLSKFCADHGIKLTQMKRMVTGGAPISRDDVEKYYQIAPQSELWVLYGSTEAEPMAHIEGRAMIKDKRNADAEIVEEGVNVGHISEDVDYKFIKLVNGPITLGSNGWKEFEVPVGEVGEFICTGDHVCKEYYNNPEAFLATKIKGLNGAVFHRTGDLGYLDRENNLWLVGRVNNAIVRGGKYYFPVKSEVIVKRLPFTYRCAFFGLADAKLGQKTCVAIELPVTIDAATFEFAEAKKEVIRIFAKNNTPLDEVYFVKAVPMDPRHHSKVEYSVLKKQLSEPGVIIG
jgi:acyl-CoA synthetase (AMP-forming)/AMP-acid ligase II/pimeloyl-ACP methyl ester carboxylesterase